MSVVARDAGTQQLGKESAVNHQRTTTERPCLLASAALRVAQAFPHDRQASWSAPKGSGTAHGLHLLPATNDDPDGRAEPKAAP
jgi:hypothetical protein